MLKIALEKVKERDFESPKKKFGLKMKDISKFLARQDTEKRPAPISIEHCVLAAGKTNFPYHCHAAEWEMYYALKGAAQMRTEAGVEDFKEGECAACPPGDAHQIINESAEDFEYLVITNNAPFDTYYYPDSDKVYVAPMFGANKEVGKEAMWTTFKEGATTDYWQGEE
ncbi:MAG: putative cupin superfamily protein [Candidatus Latescibacterota bacterium]|jgi:uncharacterized cupin superfamily protein